MKYIKPMNCDEFAQHLLTMSDGDTVEFACDPGVKWPDEEPTLEDVECWYFAKMISFSGYESRFILIDYCGGEEAFAIPLSYNSERYGEYDKPIVPEYVHNFFNQCVNLSSDKDYVFVEMRTEVKN